MPVFATAGSKVYIGTALESGTGELTVDDFDDIVWTSIGNLETIGAVGDTSNSVDGTFIDRARVVRMKGARDGGTMELVAGLSYTDAGQLALIAAEKSPHEFAFKVEFNDKPATGASPKNSTRMFVALVMSASEQLDGADNLMKLNASLAINSNVIRTNASAT
ncbi:hypothetical protein [Rhizobium herbae]|uniref:Phage tail protein n=1 Tax=Rhizobium herbae TaxID=508661 RepID=A0ABS4EFY0_9HYPH|nr:hypothetical protein [Rhizobium herbae]MBP1856856.1 hypothetical protein [Rhizobium herbae]